MEQMLKLANVELRLPPDELMVSPLRLLVAGLASRLGFSVDEIEDLKLSIGEAFLAIADKCRHLQGLISVRWSETPETLTVRITDPAHSFTRVHHESIFHLLQRLPGEISVGEGKDKGIHLRFNLEDRRKSLFRE